MIKTSKLINFNGILHDLSDPVVMGIMNITPDSFYKNSRYQSEKSIVDRTEQIVLEGALILDLGACSTRPGAADISEEEEWSRLRFALDTIRKTSPQVIISVDTFRASIARKCVQEYGVSMINDISGGDLDPAMFPTIAQLRVRYILMHMKGTPQNMQQNCNYDNMMQEIILYFAAKVNQLRALGVCDVVIDPGFGFSKDLEQNFELINRFSELNILNLPILAGVSRKSMIYKTLNINPEDSLNGTTVLQTLLLLKGANILRVHDVKEAVETVRLVAKTDFLNGGF